MNYLNFVAEDVRRILAKLGYSKLQDVVGKTELLKQTHGSTARHGKVDLKNLIYKTKSRSTPYCSVKNNKPFDEALLAKKILDDTLPFIKTKRKKTFSYQIKNSDRSIGASLSGEIAKMYGNYGLNKHPITLKLKGTAGQSLGAWNAGGVIIKITGDANDYVGKGMAGGEISISSPEKLKSKADKMVIIGNTCLYGATGGQLFANGIVGERFAVRNSGCVSVVEGTGDHACEYMTGGTIVVIGKTGTNFGAGMTGGLAFVYDNEQDFEKKINSQSVDFMKLDKKSLLKHKHYLKQLLEKHTHLTGSLKSKMILDNFDSLSKDFLVVKPKSSNFDDLLARVTSAA